MNRAIQFTFAALFFICFPEYFAAQITVEGVVNDATTGKPLQFVVVTVEESQAGDVTSEKGEFKVLVQSLPATLVFRLIGYENATIRVTKDKRLNVKLVESVMELNTVEIRASQLETVAGNDKRSIWDYTWCGKNLLICDYGTTLKRASLILLDARFDTLDRINAPAKPVELFTDCMGNAHFQGQDSTWQISVVEDKITFLPSESNYFVDNILRKCKSADDSRLFFEIPQGSQLFSESTAESFVFKSSNDEIYYFYGSVQDSKLIFLTRIRDEIAQKLKKNEENRDSLMQSKKHGESYASSLASKHFFYTTLVKEIYAPILTLNQETVILDYVNGRLVKFDSLMDVASIDTIGFEYDKRKPFRCIPDEQKQIPYVLDDRSAITTLYRLELSDCSLHDHWSIPHPFPEKISVSDGYIYYLHRDPKNRLNRFLSRLKME